MRRYMVVLRGTDFNKTESYTDYEEARNRARIWKCCYNGVVIIKDNLNGKVIHF